VDAVDAAQDAVAIGAAMNQRVEGNTLVDGDVTFAPQFSLYPSLSFAAVDQINIIADAHAAQTAAEAELAANRAGAASAQAAAAEATAKRTDAALRRELRKQQERVGNVEGAQAQLTEVVGVMKDRVEKAAQELDGLGRQMLETETALGGLMPRLEDHERRLVRLEVDLDHLEELTGYAAPASRRVLVLQNRLNEPWSPRAMIRLRRQGSENERWVTLPQHSLMEGRDETYYAAEGWDLVEVRLQGGTGATYERAGQTVSASELGRDGVLAIERTAAKGIVLASDFSRTGRATHKVRARVGQ
jgi:hypothetical protein